jgi:CBS domain-containing protein
VTLAARDLMTKEVKTVGPEMSVESAADMMVKTGLGALPVVDADGKMVGIVTEADLIMQDVKVRFPSYLSLLGGFIELGSLSRFEHEVRKAVAATVGEMMTAPVVTAGPDEDIGTLATRMIDEDVSRLPIVEGDKLVGIVSKHDIVASLGRAG